jgi:uncharacterized cupredoxin-like copper-binding protein
MTGMDPGSSIDVPPGKTVNFLYAFTKPGTLIIECHYPGHYNAGMQGTVTVAAS